MLHLTGGSFMKRLFSLATLLIFGLTLGFANEPQWKLDKVHSNVMFTVRHMVISEVTGFFKDYDIMLESTKPDFSDANLYGTVSVASIFTDNDRRDGHLKSDDFFNAEKFPAMSFKATSIKKYTQNKYEISGEFTIRDVTRTVVFDAVNLGTVVSLKMGTRTGWKASTTIDRFDFNLKWNQAIETGGLIVGKDVIITLNLEFVKQ